MSTYLITGCSQGLGLAMVQHLLTLPSTTVSLIIATTRSPSANSPLQKLIDSSANRAVHVEMDITSDASVAAAVPKVSKLLNGRGLDVLVSNAAVTSQSNAPFMGDVSDLTTCFDTNVVGTHRVTKAFIPLLRASRDKKIIVVSSTQGSCTRALEPPHLYAHAPDYKISKSAVNMLARQWARCLADEGFCVLTVSPGHLRTQLGTGGGRWEAGLSAEEGAKATCDIIVPAEKDQNGKFRNIQVDGWELYKGEECPW